MRLDLSKLHRKREHFERTFQSIAFDPQDDEYRVASPAELSMDVERVGPGVFLVGGHVRTGLQLECSRCLDEFDVPVEAEFQLRYMPRSETSDEAEREIGEDALATSVYEDDSLDVIDMLREQFQLALPMKPLCRDACEGLCPQCGANLNRTVCGCEPEWEDPRLAPLKELLSPEKES